LSFGHDVILDGNSERCSRPLVPRAAEGRCV